MRTTAFAAFLLFILPLISSSAEPAGSALAKELVGNNWTWARPNPDYRGIWQTTLVFHQDGTVSNNTDYHTWYWWVLDDQTVHLQCPPLNAPRPAFDLHDGMKLIFTADHTNFRAISLVDASRPEATGARKEATGEVISEAMIPFGHAGEEAASAGSAPVKSASPSVQLRNSLEANYKSGDAVQLTRKVELMFRNQSFRSGLQGEAFKVLADRPDEKKVFLEATDTDGKTIALSAPEDAVALVNSLGMCFVPVPIQSGPSAGKKVLFSIWDTRVQDYDAFLGETHREHAKPGFSQEPTHPVVCVSWEDAVAFCDWLTEKERKTGKLSAQLEYRLPTDHEWSCAVGIGELENASDAPKDKDKKAPGYPWGSSWPPPPGAGNFADETTKEAKSGRRYIDGYRDGFAYTSPVGIFLPNQFGLYDMGGNACQWCEDWYDPATKQAHLLRGGSWNIGFEPNLRSSCRRSRPANPLPGDGFRCILATLRADLPGAVAAGPDGKTMAALAPKDAVAATTAVPAGLAKATLTSASPSINSSSNGGMVLGREWDSPVQGGTETIRELGTLLSPVAKPNHSVGTEPGLVLYEGITYLMPYETAKHSFQSSGGIASRNTVSCPGFPRNSFTYATFDGVFESHYNHLILVMDKADQVVCVELVDEKPINDPASSANREEWHTYDFVCDRVRAVKTLIISHQIFLQNGSAGKAPPASAALDWIPFAATRPERPPVSNSIDACRIFRIDSSMRQLGAGLGSEEAPVKPRRARRAAAEESKILETNRWYLPKALAEVILECVQKTGG